MNAQNTPPSRTSFAYAPIAAAWLALSLAAGAPAYAQTATTGQASAQSASSPSSDSNKQAIKALTDASAITYAAKDWVKNIDLLTQIIALDPKHARAYRFRGLSYSELGQHDLAIKDRQTAVELEPNNANSHNGLCWSLILANLPADAQASCVKAQRFDPMDLAATVNLANTYLLQGNKQDAWKWYEQTIGLIDNEGDLKDGLLEDFDIFERKGWKVDLVKQARAQFEPWARKFLLAKAEAQVLVQGINAANKAKDYSSELDLRHHHLTLLAPWLVPQHPIRLLIEQLITNTKEQLAGMHSKTLEHYQRMLQAEEARLGPRALKDQGDLIVPLNDLAKAQRAVGNFTGVLPLLERAYAIAEEALGPEHPDTGTNLNNLAEAYESVAQYAKSEPLYLRALAISEKVLGSEHPSTVMLLNSLANTYEWLGQYAKAEELILRILGISEYARGAKHLSTESLLKRLANSYLVLRQYTQAEIAYKRIIGSRF